MIPDKDSDLSDLKEDVRFWVLLNPQDKKLTSAQLVF